MECYCPCRDPVMIWQLCFATAVVVNPDTILSTEQYVLEFVQIDTFSQVVMASTVGLPCSPSTPFHYLLCSLAFPCELYLKYVLSAL